MSTLSKSRIDRAGRVLAASSDITEEFIEMEDVFDRYRASHLEPLSNTTLEIQNWLHDYGGHYYIAQRLKRKPQILRKLVRLSVRLTQLQDIGGLRIIVDKNSDVDQIIEFIKTRLKSDASLREKRVTDYRAKGRDVSGYRAAHIILERNGIFLELQIRSRIQHYWAESIERTSVVYGHHLKEQEGHPDVIFYFKDLSDVFYSIENGYVPTIQWQADLEKSRGVAQKLITDADENKVFDSFVNEDIVRTLTSAQGRDSRLTNWIIVFDWKSGNFITWDAVGRNTDEAVTSYIYYERLFPADQNFEVVMIGASDISTVRQTHSHYFGINKLDTILENLQQSIVGFQANMDIDISARQILDVLVRKKCWGRKSISIDTLRNHFARGIITFDSSLRSLRDRGLIILEDSQGPVSLNLKKKPEIEAYV